MHPRHSLRALFAAVALLPGALPSVAQTQATSPQAHKTRPHATHGIDLRLLGGAHCRLAG
jgi:hypothetical protein